MVKPLRDRVLIRPVARPDLTPSGLHLAEHTKPDEIGTVVAVGHAVHSCVVGDVVLFSWTAGQEIWLHDTDERFLLMREDDLLAVVERE